MPSEEAFITLYYTDVFQITILYSVNIVIATFYNFIFYLAAAIALLLVVIKQDLDLCRNIAYLYKSMMLVYFAEL
ncbi:hypothetical protein NIES4102_00950 [Chondrocystis sp. NIES-4102]|nr:hypothetical protein NIES4102_00950 [Chondrocystis sp. NIES-4102]